MISAIVTVLLIARPIAFSTISDAPLSCTIEDSTGKNVQHNTAHGIRKNTESCYPINKSQGISLKKLSVVHILIRRIYLYTRLQTL